MINLPFLGCTHEIYHGSFIVYRCIMCMELLVKGANPFLVFNKPSYSEGERLHTRVDYDLNEIFNCIVVPVVIYLYKHFLSG